jgi:hypothetical protein
LRCHELGFYDLYGVYWRPQTSVDNLLKKTVKLRILRDNSSH